MSVALNLTIYVPSKSAEIVVEVLFGEPKVIVPGPDCWDQTVEAIPEDGAGSETVAVLVTATFVVAFVNPEITGAWVSQTKLKDEELEFPAASDTVNVKT